MCLQRPLGREHILFVSWRVMLTEWNKKNGLILFSVPSRFVFLRREQDSNLRIGFADYTLSRRASSTTRAPLQGMLLRLAMQR